MRVIAGTLGRRTLEAPEGLATRPTSDRLRETLFNVLAPKIEGARFLDLYAGSGGVGIEAASRGAHDVVLVERAAPALRVLRGNLEKLGLRGGVRVEAIAVATFLKRVRPATADMVFDIVFMDPPYKAESEYASSMGLLGGDASRLLKAGAVVIAEHRRHDKLEKRYGLLELTRVLEQGDAALSFYKPNLRTEAQEHASEES
ncbi:MAG TPA: 16S rRNA (guanine(966)-N(2))-methyltransferase RsmD [Terracidiphilus sp.]|nr:16S rRNA (guanine(966)-N(2))-methyltransferase RsmD [Terracidiphilus sp.]